MRLFAWTSLPSTIASKLLSASPTSRRLCSTLTPSACWPAPARDGAFALGKKGEHARQGFEPAGNQFQIKGIKAIQVLGHVECDAVLGGNTFEEVVLAGPQERQAIFGLDLDSFLGKQPAHCVAKYRLGIDDNTVACPGGLLAAKNGKLRLPSAEFQLRLSIRFVLSRKSIMVVWVRGQNLPGPFLVPGVHKYSDSENPGEASLVFAVQFTLDAFGFESIFENLRLGEAIDGADYHGFIRVHLQNSLHLLGIAPGTLLRPTLGCHMVAKRSVMLFSPGPIALGKFSS